MFVSQKCQYAVRAVFELSKRYGAGPVRIADIAEAQAIPARFLEVILNQLKQAGFVVSQRGSRGGYALARPPAELAVGDVIRFIEGPVGPVVCAMGSSHNECPLYGGCVFLPMWERVRSAVSGVYDQTTFQSLVEQDARRSAEYVASYAI
ncbi:MAG TPA: Rrf2 family transcriptional regulator [Planctomycetota bacterium]|nr:Rrf2 family transcriptional regulator [Planctomycetota bacterium]HRR79615.1 Rrf2 family transcriptional regulator [Planctomycetota bacterium]HRT94689.1 Rrf2 family transcriptional regulator [Planctomycetota bacterium]